MLDGDYIRWEDYYKDKYLPAYYKFKDALSAMKDEESLYKYFSEFFESAYNLMKYYIWNNGEFFYDIKRIVRKTFRLGFISDGDSWMYLTVALHGKNKGKYTKREILEFIKKNFQIFEDLTKKYEVLMVNNG